MCHSLGISVMPFSSDGVLLKQGGEPLFTFGFALAGWLPLSFLQDELFIRGLRLVLVVDGPRHVLPESDRQVVSSVYSHFQMIFCNCSYLVGWWGGYLSDSNSPCSSGGTVQRISRHCLTSDVGFQKVSTIPVFLSFMKISLSCKWKDN